MADGSRSSSRGAEESSTSHFSSTAAEATADLAGVDLAEEEDFTVEGTHGSAADEQFDRIVGVLEEAVMEDGFRAHVEDFCRTHCQKFEPTAENKLEYTTLFQEYTDFIERHIEDSLTRGVPGFSMPAFMEELTRRADELSGDVFDLLLGMGDFDEFKSLMLSWREQLAYEGGGAGGATGGGGPLSVSVTPLHAAATASAAAVADDDDGDDGR